MWELENGIACGQPEVHHLVLILYVVALLKAVLFYTLILHSPIECWILSLSTIINSWWHNKGHNLAMLTPIYKKTRNHCTPYHMRNTNIDESLSHSDVFICYVRVFVHEWSKQQLLKCFKPFNGSSSIVSLHTFEKTCILLESPFHAEWNGICANSTIYCFSHYLAL